jgi:hypothetical protein
MTGEGPMTPATLSLARRERGMALNDLAELARLPIVAVARLEAGAEPCIGHMVAAIGRALDRADDGFVSG